MLLVTLPHRLRAPEQHDVVIAEPPLADAEKLVTANRQQLARINLQLLGRPCAELRRQAAQVAVAAAKEYLRQAGEPVAGGGDGSLLMAGHQPELFHPGVWVKNFALNGLASAMNATPVNLIVDNDTAKATSLKLPTLVNAEDPLGPEASGSQTGGWQRMDSMQGPEAQIVSIAYDHWAGEVPYEERTVSDETMFATLPARAAPLISNWGFVPLLWAFWDEAIRQAERTALLGERLVAARRAFERRWGCHNLELPISQLCRSESFAWFGCHILSELPRFHALYNHCVHAYRRRYGIRSRNHPVPDLVREGEWLEAPFWTWRTGRKERARLLVRRTEGSLALRADTEPMPELPAGLAQDPALFVGAWRELEARGFKIRSRALTTTLFARLLLADVFIHGIGGGKYDELTDEIARHFYGIELPGFLVLSATLLLPLSTFPARRSDCQRLSRRVRDLHYNPQRHLPLALPSRATEEVDGGARNTPVSSVARALAAEKEVWIAAQPTNKRARRERFQALRELTGKLRSFVSDPLSRRQQELIRCNWELQANAVLQRRDYAFCLYPEVMLRSFCAQFLSLTRSL